MIKQLSIEELRPIVQAADRDSLKYYFDYVDQFGRIKVGDQWYTFPLWPTYELQPVQKFPSDKAIDFWLFIAGHWLHQSFVDDTFYWEGKPYAACICVRCGVRAIIPVHSFVSVDLKAAAQRGYNHIKMRLKMFELRRLWQLGVFIEDETARAIAEQPQYDPVLDSWKK